MGISGYFYKIGIVISCIFLMFASITCTGWFFYSWLEGIPGIIGALVGCSVQILAYGFSGVVVNQVKGFLRVVLIILVASALALSVLSSYSTLTGYFLALESDREVLQNSITQKQQVITTALNQRMKLMESMTQDVAIASEAANQGVAEQYRTQAGKFLDQNSARREDIEAQIEKLEKLAQSELLSIPEAQEASPIEGLSSVFGGQSLAIIILCAWLAVMFDALPIAGIMLLETRHKRAEEQMHSYDGRIDPLVEPLHIGTIPPQVQERLREAVELVPEEGFLIEYKAEQEEEQRILTNICSPVPELTKAFFIALLGFRVKHDSGWYIQLCAPENEDAEIGVIERDHELVPDSYRGVPQGMYLTILVPDVDATYVTAIDLGLEIQQEPRNEFYGQRRFLIREPGGCLVDICSPWQQAS